MDLKKRLSKLMQNGIRYYTICSFINISNEDIEDFFDDKADADIVKKISVLVDKLEKMTDCINYYGE